MNRTKKILLLATLIVGTAGFTGCTTPTGGDTSSAYIPAPGQSPQEFMRQEQRPFLNQRPTATQVQAAQAGITAPGL